MRCTLNTTTWLAMALLVGGMVVLNLRSRPFWEPPLPTVLHLNLAIVRGWPADAHLESTRSHQRHLPDENSVHNKTFILSGVLIDAVCGILVVGAGAALAEYLARRHWWRHEQT